MEGGEITKRKCFDNVTINPRYLRERKILFLLFQIRRQTEIRKIFFQNLLNCIRAQRFRKKIGHSGISACLYDLGAVLCRECRNDR